MVSPECSIAAGFLDLPEKQLFHLLLSPTKCEVRGSILYLHPFAEEMHKSRRNVASMARALAANGFIVMLPDLTGCGDGPGEFADADWDTWLEDAAAALAALRTMWSLPLTVWGLRTGALLGCEVARREEDVQRLVLWQPVLNGEQQIDQFLRLRSDAAAVDSQSGFDRKSLWGELREGRSLEIAGYELSSALAMQMSKLRLFDLVPPCTVGWAEVSATAEFTLPSANVQAHWREQGVEIADACVRGDAFWRNHDAAINTDLQKATMGMLG
ncbi:MAG: hydrolase 2, exosortase A system-associated [Halioglobus sp.]|nr:hydrolase 2, exosortase A system-associated [Halioglobus sp.]